ncbi:hypothetical protein B296_00014155 [Ensete ventricosum]|uniref:Uncharacterized protein n=1 Tax=Ensete ventricosum TaxID=4639 RepID=A0A427ANG9_ENSVE|nr:hypothetical protein B296_00014155 [Ensete ventricosum]
MGGHCCLSFGGRAPLSSGNHPCGRASPLQGPAREAMPASGRPYKELGCGWPLLQAACRQVVTPFTYKHLARGLCVHCKNT